MHWMSMTKAGLAGRSTCIQSMATAAIMICLLPAYERQPAMAQSIQLTGSPLPADASHAALQSLLARLRSEKERAEKCQDAAQFDEEVYFLYEQAQRAVNAWVDAAVTELQSTRINSYDELYPPRSKRSASSIIDGDVGRATSRARDKFYAAVQSRIFQGSMFCELRGRDGRDQLGQIGYLDLYVNAAKTLWRLKFSGDAALTREIIASIKPLKWT